MLEKNVISFYEKNASSYEEQRFTSVRGEYEDNLQERIIFEMVNSWKSLDILDLGCGTGRFSVKISKWGSTVIALDPSFFMLKKFKEKIKTKYNKIELVRGDGYELPFKNNSFAGCICINVLSHIVDYEKIFIEVHRILKRGGFFIFNIPNLHSILLPIGMIVNLRKKSLINPVYTKWYALGKVKRDLQTAGFKIEAEEYILVPTISPLPLKIIKKLNELTKNPVLKNLGSGVFIKAIAEKK